MTGVAEAENEAEGSDLLQALGVTAVNVTAVERDVLSRVGEYIVLVANKIGIAYTQVEMGLHSFSSSLICHICASYDIHLFRFLLKEQMQPLEGMVFP